MLTVPSQISHAIPGISSSVVSINLILSHCLGPHVGGSLNINVACRNVTGASHNVYLIIGNVTVRYIISAKECANDKQRLCPVVD